MKRSKHRLSHQRLLSCNMGSLVPIGLYEVLPGDTIQQATSLLLRVSPLLAPVMHPVQMRVHHWYVPHRLIWEDFESFITGGSDGMDASVFPTVDTGPTGTSEGGLGDYLGIPTGVNDLIVSALPYRAYAMIYNEWYRDQDLVTELVIDKSSGLDTTTASSMQNVAWEKDYFTSARPWTQKGPEVTLPLGTRADVRGIGAFGDANWARTTGTLKEAGGVSTDISTTPGVEELQLGKLGLVAATPASADFPDIYADLTTATAASINDLRLAFALQRYEEARARYGSRYTEYLRYLGVKSSDARLQRPEYLGGGKQVIQFSEVLQTAEGTDPVGEMKGHGIGALRSRRFRRYIEEHGYVMSLLSIKPKTIYTQGLARHWNRRTKEDFWQKELQNIGQQAILNKELYADHTTPEGTFGYQDRYDEYRRELSTVHGDFRTTKLDFWHMARIFTGDPTLNEAFITSTPTQRIHAVSTDDVLWIMARHSIQARRMVAKMGGNQGF